jgi:choline dehydrogenase
MFGGTITLDSSPPLEASIIDPPPRDHEVTVAVFKIARQSLSSDVMNPLLANTIVPVVYPSHSVSTDAEMLKLAMDNIVTIWHAAGTYKVGRSDYAMAVVDSKRRLRGFNGMRIIEASTSPFLPPGRT